MGIKSIMFLVAISIILQVTIGALIKKNQLPPASALLWFVFGLVILTIPIFSGFYRYIAVNLLGFNNTTYVIFSMLIGFLVLYVIHLTIKMKQSSDKIQILISELAIVEAELEELREGSKDIFPRQ